MANDGIATANGAAAAINDVVNEIGEDIQARGFREDWDLADKLESLCSDQPGFDIATEEEMDDILKSAARALRTNVLGMKIALMHSELSEALESLRDVGAEGVLNREGNVPEEFSDTFIRIADTCQMIKAPLGDEIVRKVVVNKSRPWKHGRKV